MLDVGCGAGAVTALLAERGAEVIGVDVDDALLAHARERRAPPLREARRVSPQCGRLRQVRGVWSSFVAAYFADLAAFVTRLRELLNEGGAIHDG